MLVRVGRVALRGVDAPMSAAAEQNGAPDPFADRAAGRALRAAGVRRVAAERDRPELRRGGSPEQERDEEGERDVSDGRESGDVPGSVEAEPEAERERGEEKQRAEQADGPEARAPGDSPPRDVREPGQPRA